MYTSIFNLKTNLALLVVVNLISLKSFANPSLEGIWETGCQGGLKKEQLIKLPFVDVLELFHKDKDCQSLSFKFRTSGTLLFNKENPSWIDFTYQQIQLTVYVEAVINDLNERAVCGKTDWKLGEPQTITGLQCALFNVNKPTPIPKQNDQKFGIYSVVDDQLFYGQMSPEADGSSPLKRPVNLDKSTVYFRHLEIF